MKTPKTHVCRANKFSNGLITIAFWREFLRLQIPIFIRPLVNSWEITSVSTTTAWYFQKSTENWPPRTASHKKPTTTSFMWENWRLSVCCIHFFNTFFRCHDKLSFHWFWSQKQVKKIRERRGVKHRDYT